MKQDFENVQRIVLRGHSRGLGKRSSLSWEFGCHLFLQFGPKATPLRFLQQLQREGHWPTRATDPSPSLQVSLGLSRLGLERVHVPRHVLALFALKSPAFWAGAPVRAARHLEATGPNAAAGWRPEFALTWLHGVISLHARDWGVLQAGESRIRKWAAAAGIGVAEEKFPVQRLPAPNGGDKSGPDQQWTHFGYRDGLSQIGIEGWTQEAVFEKLVAKHKAGEFMLGHIQDSGANPWIAGPGQRVWPEEVRSFFRDGSFGVLHQIQQYVGAFEYFVEDQVKKQEVSVPEPVPRPADWSDEKARARAIDEVKAKLCGRYPDGRSLAPGAPQDDPTADFDYSGDDQGLGCPYGSHVRRMNPRGSPQGDPLAHGARDRPLLRRGMPYGSPWPEKKEGEDEAQEDNQERGLMGHFFCASIEDQYEHLIGQWAERVPLGSRDGGGARDPLIGAHARGDGPFEIPRKEGGPLLLHGLQAFTRTRGIAYLFYPSLTALQGIADSSLWRPLYEDDA